MDIKRPAKRLLNPLIRRLVHHGEPQHAYGDPAYPTWFRAHQASAAELQAQRGHAWPDDAPSFSIIVPLWHTTPEYLATMGGSVLAQTYRNYELILVNADPDDAELARGCRELTMRDARVKVIDLAVNGGITANHKAGIAHATGDFICFLDHDDWIEPDLLYHYALAITEDATCDLLYCDEDLVRVEGGRRYHDYPLFKQDPAPDLLACKVYMLHMIAIRSHLMANLPDYDERYDGAQDFRVLLWGMRHARTVRHIPRVLYHFRMTAGSTAANADAKPYGRRAYRLAAEANMAGYLPHGRLIGTDIRNTVNYWLTPQGTPKASVIVICDGDERALRVTCESLRQVNGWDRTQVIIAGPGADKATDLDWGTEDVIALPSPAHGPDEDGTGEGDEGAGRAAERTYDSPAGDASGEGTYALLNRAAAASDGDFITFIPAGAAWVSAQPLEQLMGWCQVEGIGAVGGRVLWCDQTVKSYGIALTPARVMPLYRGVDDGHAWCMNDMHMNLNPSALSWEGMMVSRATWEASGGFDPLYQGMVGAADFSRRVASTTGKRLTALATVRLLTADVPVHRWEEPDDSPDFTPADIERFDGAWPGLRAAGDPQFNPNFDQASGLMKLGAPRPEAP